MTNTGGTSLVWSAEFDASKLEVTPASATLAAGESAEVTVSPEPFTGNAQQGVLVSLGDIALTSDVPGSATQTVAVNEYAYGFFVWPPPDVDFGAVYITQSKTVTVGPAGNAQLLASGNPDFILSGLAPQPNGTWQLTFLPQESGPQSATLTLGAFTGCVWPPNSFKATGTGVYDTACSHVDDGARCGTNAFCLSGVCTPQQP